MTDENQRWKQRFDNYKKALKQLSDAVDTYNHRELNPLEKQGLIQGFEYTHELAWNTIKDFFKSKGNTDIYGSRDATKQAFNQNLIEDGQTWIDMIKSRNKSTHTYNQEIADELIDLVVNKYYSLFILLKNKFDTIMQNKESE